MLMRSVPSPSPHTPFTGRWVSESLKECLFQILVVALKVFQYDSCDLQDKDECTESPSICGERIKCLNTPGKLYSLIIKE